MTEQTETQETGEKSPITLAQITPAQWQQVDNIREWWLNVQSTEQYPDEEVIETAKMLLTEMGVEIPLILCVSSPHEAKAYSVALHGYHQRAELLKKCSNDVFAEHAAEIGGSQVSLAAYLAGKKDGEAAETSAVLQRLQIAVMERVQQELPKLHCDPVTAARENPLQFYCGTWRRAWACYYEGGKAVGAEFDEQKYERFRRFCLHCPIWIWDKNAIYILRNPTELYWKNGLVHNDKGPAIVYSPDFKLWVIDGVTVDEQIVMRPETQSVEQIRNEPNEEVKRIRITRYGWERYLTDIDAVVLDEGRNDIENTYEVLMRYDSGCVLVCACPSTGKKFFLEVADVQTREEAQDWLHSGSTVDSLIPKTRVIGRS